MVNLKNQNFENMKIMKVAIKGKIFVKCQMVNLKILRKKNRFENSQEKKIDLKILRKKK
jgi:hypothetical protein